LKTLVWLSNYFEDKLAFREMSKQDILRYLKKDKSALENDKSQNWMGTYNGRQMILLKFFKWLYYSDESNTKLRKTPECISGIKQLRRQDRINYKPSDMWYSKESSIFLKYCPSKRDKAYHAMAVDTSCRPKELLDLRISQISFKRTDDGKQYAEVVIKGGKSVTRSVPLIDSLPYVKDYLLSHKSGGNPDSWLFVSESNTTFGSKLTYDGLSYKYKYFYKSKFFPRLLDDQTVPEEDKGVIRSMLCKPWNLYIFRHSSLTEKSTYLKEPVLRLLAGWTMSSKMPQVYIHYLGNESVNSLLEAKGILKAHDISMNPQTKYCNNCGEPAQSQLVEIEKIKHRIDYDGLYGN
jgi:integrase